MTIPSPFLHTSLTISLWFLTLALILSTIRLIIGPKLADRVITLDAILMMFMSVIVILAMLSQQPLYLDIAIALAMVSFLSTLAFSQFIHWQLQRDTDIRHHKNG